MKFLNEITGNTSTTTKIKTPVTINGVSFNGSANIVVADSTKLPSGSNAVSATKLVTARTVTLTGDASGSTSFDGTANVSISVVIADDSHAHTIANVDSLQATLDGKAPLGYYGLGSVCTQASTDWNNYKVTGFYMGSALLNAPPALNGAHSWWYVTTTQHNATYCVQNATDFNNKATYSRAFNGGTWMAWVRVYTSDFKPTPSELGAVSTTDIIDGGTF